MSYEKAYELNTSEVGFNCPLKCLGKLQRVLLEKVLVELRKISNNAKRYLLYISNKVNNQNFIAFLALDW